MFSFTIILTSSCTPKIYTKIDNLNDLKNF